MGGAGHGEGDRPDAAVLASRPVDPSGSSSSASRRAGPWSSPTYPEAPELYSGILTCSSPQVPGPAHESTRVVVFLGTQDPNYGNATAVRNLLEGQKTGAVALMVVEGAEHNDLPEMPYVDLALDFVFAKGTLGHEARVPKQPPVAVAGPYRHVMVSWTGAEGSKKGLERKKAGAKSIAEKIEKAAAKGGKVFFPHEAQAFSDDRESGPVGRITRERLLAFGVLRGGPRRGPLQAEAGRAGGAARVEGRLSPRAPERLRRRFRAR